MGAVLLGLISSLGWGVGDFLAGVEARRRPLSAVLALSQSAGFATALVIAVGSGEPVPSPRVALAALGAGALLITAIAMFYKALTLGLMGVVAPVMAASAVIPVMAGVLSGERLQTLQALGVACCCVGVILATRKPVTSAASSDRGGVGHALVAMAAFGCFLVVFDHASSTSLFWSVAVSRVAALAAVGVVIGRLRRRPRLTGPGAARAALVGLLDVGALVCFGIAAGSGLLSIVAVLASLYPAVTVVLARVLLEERLAPMQHVGIVAALAGVAALAAS